LLILLSVMRAICLSELFGGRRAWAERLESSGLRVAPATSNGCVYPAAWSLQSWLSCKHKNMGKRDTAHKRTLQHNPPTINKRVGRWSMARYPRVNDRRGVCGSPGQGRKALVASSVVERPSVVRIIVRRGCWQDYCLPIYNFRRVGEASSLASPTPPYNLNP